MVDSAGFEYAAVPDMLRQLKIRTTTETLASELARACRTIRAESGTDHPQLADAVAALLTNIGVYRCDYPVLSQILGVAIGHTAAADRVWPHRFRGGGHRAGQPGRRVGRTPATAVRSDDGQVGGGLLLLP